MKREYKDYDSVEICVEMQNGEFHSIFGEIHKDEDGIIRGETHSIYTQDELLRRGVNDPRLWVSIPKSDLTYDIINGFFAIKKGDDIVFMERRDEIKKFQTFINDEPID